MPSRMRFRNLERFRTGGIGDRMELSIPLPRTPDGKVTRTCPNETCRPGVFQLGDVAKEFPAQDHAHRRVRQPGSPGTTCPYCGTSAEDGDFTSAEDVQAALREVEWAVGRDVGAFLQGMASDFNRRTSRNSLLKIRMDVKDDHRLRPRAYREDLLRELSCDACGRRYGVFAVGLFCPDCGAPNLLTHFVREIEMISQQISLADTARDAGQRELAFRLLGNAHEDVLTAFETYLKTAHRHFVKAIQAETISPVKPAKTNRFQNIGRAWEAFAEVDVDPFAGLSEDELVFLRLNIEKRHVVGHNLGIVDEHFAEAAQDEQPGRTVTLLAEEVTRFAALCQRVVTILDARLIVTAGVSCGEAASAEGGDDDRPQP